jgi:hypothetical protein
MWKDLVEGEFKCVVQHTRDKLSQQRTGLFDTWVSIYLNQPCLHSFVNEEVITEYLKAKSPVLFVKFSFDRAHRKEYAFLNFLKNTILKLEVALRLKYLLKLIER